MLPPAPRHHFRNDHRHKVTQPASPATVHVFHQGLQDGPIRRTQHHEGDPNVPLRPFRVEVCHGVRIDLHGHGDHVIGDG